MALFVIHATWRQKTNAVVVFDAAVVTTLAVALIVVVAQEQ